MLDQYVHLLEQVTVAPETSISDYSLITASARAWLPDPTIPIEATSPLRCRGPSAGVGVSAPERIAVSGAGTQWMYAELTGRAASLASALQRMGVGRSDVVAIVGPAQRRTRWCDVGRAHERGAFLTIDPTLPDRRRRVMLTEARAKVVCLIGQPGDNEPTSRQTTRSWCSARISSRPRTSGPEERPSRCGRRRRSTETIRPTCSSPLEARGSPRQSLVVTRGSVTSCSGSVACLRSGRTIACLS